MRKSLTFILIFVLALNLLVVPAVLAKEKEEKQVEKEEVKKEEEPEISYTMDELVVIASKHPERLSETSVSVEVIDEEEIEKKNAHNVADVLRDVAGVNIRDNGGISGQKTISIRGSSAEQVLVLIDGQPVNSRQNGQIDLSLLPVDQIEKIEVLKGPASAIYGANALGGVVNITTKSGSEEPVTKVDTKFGSFKTREVTLTHRGSKENLNYNLTILKKNSDGHRENSEIDQSNIFTKFNYELNNNSDLTMSFKYDDSDRGAPGTINYPTPNAEQLDEDVSSNLQWQRQLNNIDQKLSVYYNEHKSIFDNPDRFEYSKHDTKRTGITFDQTNYYGEHTLTYGLELKKNKINSTDNGKHDNLNKAFFIQDIWDMNDALKFNFGGRYDNHEMFGSNFSPRMGIVYQISSKLNLHTSVGKAYRTPTFNELYWPYQDFGSWGIYEGNPDLDTESITAYETGLRYLNDNFKGEVNLFKKDADNLINWNEGNDGIKRPYNVDEADIKGVELILTKQLSKNIFTDFNYTYLDVRDGKGQRLDYKPYHTANIGLNYNKNEVNVSLSGEFIGSRYYSDGDYILPSYFIADLKLSKLLTKNAEVSLEINNLFDRNYEVIEEFSMPGRNVMIELSREF
ncbi:TonB-dependent receptor plug domain-containing protein [Selenihalanaerobacter shriftii]|uniref:Outer membrane receptor for ferrienterochelin and colicins n=1 Tax=Selenihalanaerobacter shriftii TaxID=142842 RepID=A0A1T4K0V5_9FIRM|nr:TonB-dependent receptor [Selenihalanaerobacter shriftii]SJZ36122.1 outer membrane receptor for ferrienterochelin and colicins [Selenihalanaerobacter shriftii]